MGHSHPRVVRAAREQLALLNTNTRYLHDHLAEYAERLAARLPEPLEVCYFVCSGSEANELALRMARTATGAHDVVVLDGAYHGHTGGMVDLSPYKFDRAGGAGRPAHVHVAPVPDTRTRPRWETSNTPTDSRTARCSSSTLSYCTGIDQPPKSTNLAPSSRCSESSGAAGMWRVSLPRVAPRDR